MSLAFLATPIVQTLVGIFVPQAFNVINTLVAAHPKLSPFAAEIAALEAEVLALLNKQVGTPTVTAAPAV